MNKIRRQLTLFVDENQSKTLEQIRKEFNPEQSKLIRSHVTLCKDDELINIEKITQTLTNLNHNYITIDFEPIVRFSDDKGVLMPAKPDNGQFQKLREIILNEVIENPCSLTPHITLMHPRNSTCTNKIFEQIKLITLDTNFEFRKISLIEQEGGNKWNILKEFELK